MYNTAEQLDKEKLIRDEQFLDDASEFLRKRTGNFYVEPEEIFDNYLEHMRFHSTNDITPVRDLMFAQKADDNMKNRMARLFSSYDKLEADANDDILQLAGDYVASVALSPSTWLGLITAGAGKVASLGAQQAARTGVRGLIYQGVAKAPITSGALTGAAVEGTAAGATEKARQMARTEVGAQEEDDDLAVALNTVIGGALGGVGGALTGKIKKNQVAEAQTLLETAEASSAEARKLAAERADKVIADAGEETLDALKNKLKPLDPDAVAEGKALRKDLTQSELFILGMDADTKKSIMGAALEIIGPEDISGTKRITEIVADRIRDRKFSVAQLDEIANKYNLSQEQLRLIFLSDFSDAGRTLATAANLKKSLQKLAVDMQELATEEFIEEGGELVKKTRGVRMSETQDAWIREVTEQLGALSREVSGGMKGFERMRRAILTTQPQTLIRNFAGGAARILIDMPETWLENATRHVMNAFRKDGKKFTPDDFRSDSTSIFKFLSPITIGDKNRVTAEVIANLFEKTNPEAAQQLFGTFIDAAYVAKKGKLGGILEGIGGALNFANRFADNYFKKAIFTGELNRLVLGKNINNKKGRDLIQIIADGDFDKIDGDTFKKATDKAFELLYQKYPTGDTNAGKIARLYLELDKQAASGMLMGMLIPFPRFVINQIEFIYDHAPIIGMFSSASAPEKIAKQITGVSMIMGAYALRAKEGEGKQWYNYTNEDGSTTDLRPFLGPLSMPFYLADLLYRNFDSNKSATDNVNAIVKGADAGTVAEIMIGSAMRVGAGAYFAETALPELVDWAAGINEDSDFVSSQKFEKAMGRFAGDYVSTFTYAMPISIARDLYKITDAEARLVNETNGQVMFGDIFTVRASRALPQPLKEKALESLERRPLVNNRYVITSEEPTETRDPATTALTGLARSRPLNQLEEELNKIGLESYDLYRPVPFGPADVLIRQQLSGAGSNGKLSLNNHLKPLIQGRKYKELDKASKRDQLKTEAKKHIRFVKDQVFDVLVSNSRKGTIDYTVPEVMRFKFESQDTDSKQSAIVNFRKLRGRKPDVKDEKDLKLLIELAEDFAKKFSAGGLVTGEPRKFSEGGAVVGRTRAGQPIYDSGVDDQTKQMVELGLDLAPVTGEIRSAQAAVEDFEKGDYGMAALGAIGALPIVGIPGRVAKKAITKAINVRKDKKADIDFAELIMSGDKKFETRDTDSLRPYVGQRIGIAKTGDGEAKAIGSVEIGEPIEVDEKMFRQLQDQHLVPAGTDFDIKPGGKKYLYPVSNPERFDAPKSVGRGIVSRKILDDEAEALELLNDRKLVKDWQKENRLSENQRQKQTEEMKKAAQDLFEGNITGKEYRAISKSEMPIKPITKENFPDMPTKKQIVGALDENKSAKGIVGLNLDIPDGTRVGSRLDIPAYDYYNTWVVSLHDGMKQGGDAIGYGQTAVLNNVEFFTSAKTGLDIAREAERLNRKSGKIEKQGKSTIARIHGDWENRDPQEVYKLAMRLMDDPEWKQVGMNPFRHSFFYDKATGKPVTRADEVIQVGPLVLAKGARSTLSDLKKLKIKSADGKVRVFNSGGLMSRK